VAIKIEAAAVKTIVVGQITEADLITAVIRVTSHVTNLVTNLVMSRAIILATIPATSLVTTVARIMSKSQRAEVMETIAIVIVTRLRRQVRITLPYLKPPKSRQQRQQKPMATKRHRVISCSVAQTKNVAVHVAVVSVRTCLKKCLIKQLL